VLNQQGEGLNLAEIIMAARGEKKVDLLFINGQVINVLSGEIYPTSVAVHNGLVVGFGEYLADQVVDLKGKVLCPGFIDGHMHMESSMVTPTEFASVVLPRGTTTVVVDPHEIANVRGIEGIKYILRAGKHVPLDIYGMVPSCVPATPLETSGCVLSADDLQPSFTKDRILGLGELMDFPGVLKKDPHVLRKIGVTGGMRVDGHAPGVSGKDLYAYIAAGAVSDHECTTYEEAHEKLRLGMYIMIREGSLTRDLEALLPLVTPVNMRRCMFVTDDRHPVDLIEEGHIDYMVRRAVKLGVDPAVAVALASINTAEYFGLKNLGAIAPGYLADLLVLDNIRDFNVEQVFKRGKLVASRGEALFSVQALDSSMVENTVNFKPFTEADLAIPAQAGKQANVIGLQPDQIVTLRRRLNPKVENDMVVADTDQDILKLVVVERHHATGNIGRGLIQGFGLQRGALASTVGHDSHNLIIVGTNDHDMVAASQAIKEMQGGQVAVVDGRVIGRLPLPIAGLMSKDSLREVRNQLVEMLRCAAFMGDKTGNAFMTLSFMALAVIPELKVTDKGLVDVVDFKIIDIFN